MWTVAVPAVSHDLVHDLFPAFHASFNEDLGADGKGPVAQFSNFFIIIGKATFQAAKRISRTDDDWIANFTCIELSPWPRFQFVVDTCVPLDGSDRHGLDVLQARPDCQI